MGLSVKLERETWISYDNCETFTEGNEELYWANITHNLGNMAEKAGIYEALWRPYILHNEYKDFGEDYQAEYTFEDSVRITAKMITPILQKGYDDLVKKPKYFQKFNSKNGWGTYEHFLPFVKKYLDACYEYPNSIVITSR